MVLVSPRKPSQRDRLLEAMKHVACREGYSEMNVVQLCTEAQVSKQTFYRCFEDKEDCFKAAFECAALQILGRIQQTIENTGDWSQIPERAVCALIEEIESDPEAGWLCFVESMAGGANVRHSRNRALADFESVTEDFLSRAPANGQTLDIPAIALVGAIRGIAATYLSNSSVDQLPGVVDDLVAWIGAYAIPAGKPRWSASEAALLPLDPSERRRKPLPLLPRPEPLPRGRHGMPASAVARNQRERIIHATAEVSVLKGYNGMAVTDIVSEAGISTDVFYEHFHDKQSAFLAAQQYAFKDTFMACARVFFSKPTWPERMWHSLRLLTILIAKEPALSHLRMIEPYAAGPTAMERMQEMISNFAIFIQEGYHYRPQAQGLPSLFSDAVSGAIFEIIRHELASRRADELPRRVPQLTYTAIAPFTGPVQAVEIIEGLIAQQTRTS